MDKLIKIYDYVYQYQCHTNNNHPVFTHQEVLYAIPQINQSQEYS